MNLKVCKVNLSPKRSCILRVALVEFLLWLHPFILSGVVFSLISSSLLGTYRPGEFIFQCPIFLPSHTVHGVLKARILKWFSIPFSMNHILSDLSTMIRPSWVAPHGMA